MIAAPVLAGYLAAITLLMLTPGPDMMFVLANAARYGTRAGMIAALGIAAGETLHVAAVILGLATVITASPVLFAAIRYAGALYLVVLGLLALRRGSSLDAGAPDIGAGGGGLRWAFTRGLLTNLINPKMIMFSVAFLPQFVRPETGDVTPQLVTLGVVFVAVQLTLDMILTATAGRLTRRLTNPRWARRIECLCATAFIALGLRLAWG